jgi:hypothetical protein
VGEADELLVTVPFRDRRKRRLIRLKHSVARRKKPHRDRSTDGAD